MHATSPAVGSSRSWKSTEMEIQSLLEKLLDINDSMSRCAASAAPTTSVTQSLTGIGTDCMTLEFRRIQGSIISLSQDAELLNSVRDDISEYKSVNRNAVATGRRELPFISQWAHFPHIHFGMMPDQPVKKPNVCQQEGDDVLMKDGFLADANVGISPY